jgi:hypothetical protein
MAAGWALNAAMVYLILVTARTTPDIWDPYDVLGVSRVCTRWTSCVEATNRNSLPTRKQSRSVTEGYP